MADADEIFSSTSFKSAFAGISSSLVSSVQRLRTGSGDLDDIEARVQQLQDLEKRQREDISSMIRSWPHSGSQPESSPRRATFEEWSGLDEDQLVARSAESLALAENVASRVCSLVAKLEGKFDDERRLCQRADGLDAVADGLTVRVEALEHEAIAQSTPQLQELVGELQSLKNGIRSGDSAREKLAEIARSLEVRAEKLEQRKATFVQGEEAGSKHLEQLADASLARFEEVNGTSYEALENRLAACELEKSKLEAEFARYRELVRKFPMQASFAVGDQVKVQVAMTSACQEAYSIPVGMVGRILHFDDEGDALIDFDTIPKNTWISEEHLHKLTTNQEEHTIVQPYAMTAAVAEEPPTIVQPYSMTAAVVEDAIGNQNLKDMEDRLAHQLWEHSSLKSELQSERETRSQLEENLQLKASEVASLHQELSHLRQTLCTFEAERNAPPHVLDNVDDVIDINAERRKSAQLEIFLNDLKSTLDHEKFAASEQAKEMEDLKARLQDSLRDLAAEREETQRLKASHSDAFKDMSSVSEDLKARLEDSLRDLAAEREETQRLKASHSDAFKDMSSVSDETNELRKQLSRATQHLDETVRKFNMMEESYNAAVARLSAAEEKSQRLQADLDARAQRISELDESARRMSADRDLYQNTVEVTQQETENLRQRLEEVMREKEHLGSQSRSLEEMERSKAQSLDKAREEADNLRSRLLHFENLLQERTEKFESLEAQLMSELEAQKAKSRDLQATQADALQYSEMLKVEKNSRMAVEAKCSELERSVAELEAKCFELVARRDSTPPQERTPVRLADTPPLSPEKAVQAVPLEQALAAQTIAKLRLKLAQPHASLDQQALQVMLERVQGEQVCLQTTVQTLLKDVQGLRQSSQEFFTAASTSKNELSQAILKNNKLEEDNVNLKISVASRIEDLRLLEEEKHKLGVQYENLRATTVSKEEYLRLKGALESDWQRGLQGHYVPTIDGVLSSARPMSTKFAADAQQFTISTPGRSRSPISPRTSPPPEQQMVIPGVTNFTSVKPPHRSLSSSSVGTIASPITLSPTEFMVPPLSLGTSSAPTPGVIAPPTRRASDGLASASGSHSVPGVPLGTSSVPERRHMRSSSPAYLQRQSSINSLSDHGAFLARTAQPVPSRSQRGGAGLNYAQTPGLPVPPKNESFRMSSQPNSVAPRNEVFRMSSQPSQEVPLFTETVRGAFADPRLMRQSLPVSRPVILSRDPTTR